ncbi:hypothetical protein [Mesoterricola silvestris]|uniref:Motility protein n=1 Tax=Mesoterricola silvestris TaxID=2927979 RepID=A0AA48H2M5_9BACT|nr:hypothetical protein [Mesoterricola silvestris]BDU74878.1 hypothetical protein METEAL_40520 [Mesoterricola silvestris]
MDVSLSVDSLMSQQASMTQAALGVGVERKVLDMAQAEGAALVRLIDSAGGLGGNINTYA